MAEGRGGAAATLDDRKPGVELGHEAPEAQGKVAPGGHPIIHQLVEHLAHLTEEIHRYQVIESDKQPDNFVTLQAVAVPDQTQANGAVPVELSAKRANRNTIVVSNTGTHSVFIGNSSRDAKANGFTVAAGASLAIEARNAVWAWAPAASSSTVDVLETLYGEPDKPTHRSIHHHDV
jgi:hypothetical protein